MTRRARSVNRSNMPCSALAGLVPAAAPVNFTLHRVPGLARFTARLIKRHAPRASDELQRQLLAPGACFTDQRPAVVIAVDALLRRPSPARSRTHVVSSVRRSSEQKETTASRKTPRMPSCRSRSRVTGLPQMRSWKSKIRAWAETRSPTASRSSTAPYRLPPGHVRCSSTRWVVPCHRFP
jgi:hypothetical protein